MSLDAGDQATVIGVGVAVLLAHGAGIFKCASLRGDMNNRWTRRVSLAVSGLDEKAIRELGLLRDDVEDTLPSAFDPGQAITDPSPLTARATKITEYYGARTRMRGDFDRLLRVCPVVLYALTALAVATVALTVYYAELWDWTGLEIGGAIVGGAGALALVLSVAAYVVLQHRLADAEILAGTDGLADEEGSG